MTASAPNVFQRLALAIYAFFAVLGRPEVAVAVRELRERGVSQAAPPSGAAGATPPAERAAPAVPPAAEAPPAAPAPSAAPAAEPRRVALQLLALLQREGRLVDFVEEDVAAFPDAAVGAAARTVHAGCKKAIRELFQLEPVLREAEGAPVTVPAGFDPAAIRLTGNVVGAAPFHGSLRHHGWRARSVSLPPLAEGLTPEIVAPAEVEL